MELSLHWAERSKDYYLKNADNIYGAQFGIIQGGVFEDLRKTSIKENINLDFHGYAIGGLAVGEGHEEMVKVLDYTTPSLPENKVRYLMGVGRPKDIVEAVYRGVDIFDCVVPTREGRHGNAYLGNKNINLKNSKFEDDHSPLDKNSDFFVSNKYSKGYLHHLLKINDPLGSLLISIHNLSYYFSLMKDLRESIENNKLEDFRELFYQE
jgi:queuine tRNA-ribosyltransferase